MNYRNARLSQQ